MREFTRGDDRYFVGVVRDNADRVEQRERLASENAFVGGEDRGASTWVTFSDEGCRVYVDGQTVSVVRTDGEAAVDRR